uniref:Sulfotransferase n=1 Tax=Oryza glumipatula TaxID=40148 RepID=A0A0E0AC34_9ORYZ
MYSSSSMKPSSPSQANQDADDAKTYKELYQRCTDLVSSWPSRQGLSYLQLFRHEKGWYNGVTPLVGTMVADELFAPRPSDIVVATLPKSGTTWIKALLYATVHRREHPADAAGDHPFNSLGPHECVKFLEYQLYRADEAPDLDALTDPRLFATHAPFDLLPRAVVAAAPPSGCKVVYVCRDPKDTLVSLLQFVNEYNSRNGRELVAVDAAVGFFCDGVSPFGPYWEHVLGYWRAHRERPEQVLFLRYEEMKRDPAGHVRRLAEFAGVPFTSPEEDGGAVDAIVRLCSFDNMVGLEATKGGRTQLTTTTVPNSAFFRRGEVGDWANHLSPEMAQRIDAITEAKFAGFGLAPSLIELYSARLYILAMDGLPKLTANELKSQRARERYTALSVEEKAALVQRNPENRERKNSASTSGTGSQTVNCQPSFQPVPSSTPMSSSTPDVAAIVCDVGPIDHYANFPNSVRKVALMDSNKKRRRGGGRGERSPAH